MILKLENISKSYFIGNNELKVLDGLSLEIKESGIIILMGASGTGKSTLLHLTGLLDKPSSGSITIGGKDVSSLDEKQLSVFRNEKIGFVFQFHHLLPEFTALENVAMPGYISGMPKSKAEERAKELLAAVGMEHRIDHKPNEMSGGEQQRAAVARALLNKPEIILADEPTGNLDRKNSRNLRELIWKLSEKTGQTFLIATHNERLTEKADKVLELTDGKIREL